LWRIVSELQRYFSLYSLGDVAENDLSSLKVQFSQFLDEASKSGK